MNLILNIDTAVTVSSICLSDETEILGERSNPNPMDSASWIHVAIDNLLKEKGVKLTDLAAIAVSAGPGSYTGLRVGMATAKGFCYMLDKPLICLNTLEIMASAAGVQDGWICPMIDARRMEVFTAIYDAQLQQVLAPTNLILDEDSFSEQLSKSPIYFLGNGAEKFRRLTTHPAAQFLSIEVSSKYMAKLSHNRFQAADFASLAYAIPFYGKDFYSVTK